MWTDIIDLKVGCDHRVSFPCRKVYMIVTMLWFSGSPPKHQADWWILYSTSTSVNGAPRKISNDM